jgi:hypothetical protein
MEDHQVGSIATSHAESIYAPPRSMSVFPAQLKVILVVYCRQNKRQIGCGCALNS